MIRRLSLTVLLACCAASPGVANAGAGARPDAATLARACSGCHSLVHQPNDPTIVLGGMSRAKFISAMQQFKSGKRPSSIMNRIAKGYQDRDFEVLADYFEKR